MGIGSSSQKKDGRNKLGGATSESLENIVDNSEEQNKECSECPQLAYQLQQYQEQQRDYERQISQLKESQKVETSRIRAQYEQQQNDLQRQVAELKIEQKKSSSHGGASQSASAQYKQQLQDMEKKIEELTLMNKELLGKSSLSHQARKLHGDVAPGDMTHDQVSTQYKDFFKSYLRALPQSNTGMNKESLQTSLPSIYKEIHECCCKEVLNELLQNLLQEVFLFDPSNPGARSSQEKQNDTATACSLLIYHLKEDKFKLNELARNIKQKLLSECKPKVLKQHIALPEAFIEDAVDLSINMLTLNPPQFMSMPSQYDKGLHEIRTSTADKQIVNMVYYRPILLQGRHNAVHVAVRGQVGNKYT